MKLNGIKALLVTSFFYLLSHAASSQELMKERIFSSELNDTIYFNIWLPYDYEKGKEEYPVLYLNNYGSFNNYGMNVAAELNKKKYKFPKSIVIELVALSNTKSVSEMLGFSYFQRILNGKGKKFLETLKGEIFPYVKEKYGTSDFKAYMGHSYCATYANILFEQYPDIFDAYILFAPESLSDIQETFEINKNLYTDSKKFYFVSTGKRDIDRRLQFNKLISSKIRPIKNVFFESQIEDSADHNSIVEASLANSLKFLFHKYFSPSHLDSTDLTGSYNREMLNVKSTYKMKNFSPSNFYYDLYDLGSQYKDKDFIQYLLSTEKAILQNPLHAFNIGYIYADTFKDTLMAEKYYRKSIEAAIAINSPQGAFNAFSWLAKLYRDRNNINEAFSILIKGYEVTGSYTILYQAARLADKDKSLKKKCIEYLDIIVDNFNKSDLEIFSVTLKDVRDYRDHLKAMK